jgi:RND family efflux transporter MFP subunit
MTLPHPKLLLPLIALFVGAGVALLILTSGDQPVQEPSAPPVPLVRVLTVEPETVRLRVATHGTIAPRTESDLVSQVSGPVVWVSPSLVSGGFFEEGDALLRVDARDYAVTFERASATLARRLSERDLAAKELARQRELEGRAAASEARLDDAENAERVSVAALREARALLDQADRDLVRTKILAPFSGRVREKYADVGQFVNRGSRLARIYAIDYAEVRLPVPDDELAFLDLPMVYRGDVLDAEGPSVELSTQFAGQRHTWIGRVVRTEGEIDPRSRMVNVVARIDNPYARSGSRPPLAVGLFVDAEILGRVAEDVVVLPRIALREGDRVHVVDEDDALRLREVEVLRRESERVLIRAGLESGERVSVSPLAVAMEGMRVRPVAVGARLGMPQVAAGRTAPSEEQTP